MCLGKGTEALSRMGILVGFISLATFLAAFVSTGWVYTNEPYRLPNLNLYTTITFKIGLWRICHTFKRINSTIIVPMPSCTYISYTNWVDINYQQLGLYTPIEFTLHFVSKIRWSTVFSGFGLLLLIIGILYSILGHCYQDNKNVIASAIYTMSGLSLSLGLFVFVCMLTGAFNDFSRYQKVSWSRPLLWSSASSSSSEHDYQYGWCFFAAGLSCALSIFSAMCTISAHYHKYHQMTLASSIDIEQKVVQQMYFTTQSHQRNDKSCLAKLNSGESSQPTPSLGVVAKTNNLINHHSSSSSNIPTSTAPCGGGSEVQVVKPDIHVTFVGEEEIITSPSSNTNTNNDGNDNNSSEFYCKSNLPSSPSLKCNTLPSNCSNRQQAQHLHHNFATLKGHHRFVPTTSAAAANTADAHRHHHNHQHQRRYSVMSGCSVHPLHHMHPAHPTAHSLHTATGIPAKIPLVSMNSNDIQISSLKKSSDECPTSGDSSSSGGGGSNSQRYYHHTLSSLPSSRQKLQSPLAGINQNLTSDLQCSATSDQRQQLPISPNDDDCRL